MTEIYFKRWCAYSKRALALLDEKGVEYTAIDVTEDLPRDIEMRERAGRTSVPQVFIDDLHVGGYDDLALLDREGRLDPLLDVAKSAA